MNFRSFRNIGSISLLVLLLSALLVIANSSVSSAASTGSDEVSTASGSNRFVVWIDYTPGNSEIFFRRSADNGATWASIVNLSSNPGDSLEPKIAVSGSNVYVVWYQQNAATSGDSIFFRRSTDNGATWGPKIKISSSGSVGSAATPEVAGSGSNVYVVWDQQGSEIYFRRSLDNGATWKPAVNLSNNPGNSENPQLAVSGSNVYVVWYQLNAGQTASDAFFRRSTDNGATWKLKINLSNSGSASFPEITVSGSNVHVAWSQADPGSPPRASVFVRSTTDGGATWKMAKNLTPSATFDSISPQIASVGSNVYVLYEHVDPNQDCCDFTFEIVFVASTNSGGAWKPGITLRESSSPRTEVGPLHQIVALGSKVYVSWHESVDREVVGDLHFSRSTDNGVTWTSEIREINFPIRDFQIAAFGSSVYIGYSRWTSDGPQDVFFLRSVDSGATWKSVKNLSANNGDSVGVQIGL